MKLVLCDLSNAPLVDLAGPEMLNELQRELAAKNIKFRIVEARSGVRNFLRVEGLEEKVGKIGRMKSIADILDEFPQGRNASFTTGLSPATTS